jgi:polysaccharide biosynthesis protein PslG
VTFKIIGVALAVLIVFAALAFAKHSPPPTANGYGISTPGIEWSARHPSPSESLDQVADLGATWFRFDLPWAATETSPGVYDFSTFDTIVDLAVAKGLNPLAILDYNNTLYAPSVMSGVTSYCNRRAFSRWAKAAAKHFKGRVKAYEVWNEPNTSYFWSPTPSAADYVALLKSTYPKIKQGDSSAIVLGGSMANTFAANLDPATFLEDMYVAGAKGYFDALSTHAYSSPRLPADDGYYTGWQLMDAPTWGLRAQMVAAGDGAKQIWATEAGAPTGGTDGSSEIVSEQEQSDQVAAGIALWKTYPWAGVLIYHTLRDPADVSTSSHEHWFGLLHEDGTDKPGAVAFRNGVQ